MTVLLHLPVLLVVVGCLLLQATASETATADEKKDADKRLTENFGDCKKTHLEHHLPVKYSDNKAVEDINKLLTLCQDGYVIRYSIERRTPLFTAQQLNGSVLSTPQIDRKEAFRRDPRLNDMQSSSLNAYGNIRKYSDFSKGHITPVGDMRTLISSLNTFILSNIAPQYSLHNNRSWNDWEKYARERAKEEGVLYVITGVTGQLKVNGYETDRFTVPKYFYKILMWCEEGVQAEYIYSLNENKERPETEWGSTSSKALTSEAASYPAVADSFRLRLKKTIKQVEKFFEDETKIRFDISASGLCPISVRDEL